MRAWKTWAAVGAMCLATGGLAQNPKPLPGHERVVQVRAEQYKFNPIVINVKKGEPLKLIVRAVDRGYGFKLKAFHVDQKVRKGEAASIEFTPNKTGTFKYECGFICGMGHRMSGKLVVE